MAKKRSTRVEEAENKARAEIRRLLLGSIRNGRWTPPGGVRVMSNMAGELDASTMDIINKVFGNFNEHLNEQSVQALYHDNETYRAMAAHVLEHNVPPSPWRDYILFILRNTRPVMPAGMKHTWRDWTISAAVECGREAGLDTTRGRHQRYINGVHSACSLVADELKEVGLHLSEDAVEKIWRWQVVGKN
jgi:hypothetical protein